jgi:hypothetical protein
MILRRWALVLAVSMCTAEASRAGVWVTNPVLGLAAEYSSDPALLYVEHTAETHGAVLLDAPTTFQGDASSLTLDPSFRVSDSSGYSSIASDYEHFTATGKFTSDRDTLSTTGELARDSSLYYDYLLNGSTGVRRDTTLADLSWTHALGERLNFNLDVNSSRVIYGQSSSFTTLTDYHYSSAAPTLSWQESERTTLKIDGSFGLYDSAGGYSKSSNSNLEVGFTHQLTELWTVDGNAGYSRENNRVEYYFGPYLLGAYESSNTGSAFTADISRKAISWTMTGAVTRSLVPTGYAFLARQTAYQLSVDYPRTERWTFDAAARWIKTTEPQVFGATTDQSYVSVNASATYLFTEKWSVTLGASRVNAKYTPPAIEVGATGVTLQLSRHFNPIVWQ